MSAMLKIASFFAATFVFPSEPDSRIPACVRIWRNLDSRALSRFLRLLIAVPFFLLTSCGVNDQAAGGDGAENAADTVAAIPTDPKRQVLMLELRRLKEVFQSGDKNQVADLFPFPAPDTVLSVYLDDSAFAERLQKNNDQLSRDIFLEFYPTLSQAMMVQEMDTLFRVLPLDSLSNRDILEQYFPVKGDPCVRYYRIAIEGDLVVIVTGVDSSKEYVNPETKQQEILSEECESAMVWVFRFDGRNLILKQHSSVG
jgi:hypothetical protein